MDNESKQFIDWAMQQMEDEQFYQSLLGEAKGQLNQFYERPKTEILARLYAKMLRGAKEHGEPTHTAEELWDELENEFIDLLGWNLIKKWNEKK